MSEPKPTPSLTIRPGTQGDTPAVFQVFYHSLADLTVRLGQVTLEQVNEPGRLEQWWQEWKPIFEHLAQTADQFCVAEQEGEVAGYARSIIRDGVRELTEFFVLPGYQSAGLGRELLGRVFHREGARHRTILATVDSRALARYMKEGVYPICPVVTFWRSPDIRTFESDMQIVPMNASRQTKDWIDRIDRRVVGYRRQADHDWLREQRKGFFYLRNGSPVGYAYIGSWSGPVAVLDPLDFPVILAHIEMHAKVLGMEEIVLDVPLVNRAAVSTLLSRGFQMGSFLVFFMSDQKFVRLENYIVSSPQFFL